MNIKLINTLFSLTNISKKAANVVLAFAISSTANAGVILVDGNVQLSQYLGNSSLDWDINNDGITDFSFTDMYAEPHITGITSSGAGAGFAYTYGDKDFLALDDTMLIDDSNAFRHFGFNDLLEKDYGIFGVSSLVGGWGENSAGFYDSFDSSSDFSGVLGFKFENSGTTNYGVASFEVASWDASSSNGFGTFTFNKWAYDNTGNAISASALNSVSVPEPTALGVMLLGLGAIALRRRQQKN